MIITNLSTVVYLYIQLYLHWIFGVETQKREVFKLG